MKDNFSIHAWKLKQAINELDEKQCPDCGCKMEGTMCNECGYMEESSGQGLGYTASHQNDELYNLFYNKAKANYDIFYKLAKKKGYSDFEIDDWYENRNNDEVYEATFTDKHDDHPELKGGQKKLPDELQAQILKKEDVKVNTPLADLYDLVEKLVAQGVPKDKILQIVNFATADSVNEGESNLTPLQQYIYDYEVEISGEEFANKELENIKKLNNIEDVVKYYGGYRGWAADKDLKPELVSLFKTLKAKFPGFISTVKLNEDEDHEVFMAKSSLQAIMGACSKLMLDLGEEERNIPGWIQDHIAKAENYIEQAAQGFHELEPSNDDKETVDEMFVAPRKHQTYMPDEWNYPLLVKLFDDLFGMNLQDKMEGKFIPLADLKRVLDKYGATNFQDKDISGKSILPRLVKMLQDKGHTIV